MSRTSTITPVRSIAVALSLTRRRRQADPPHQQCAGAQAPLRAVQVGAHRCHEAGPRHPRRASPRPCTATLTLRQGKIKPKTKQQEQQFFDIWSDVSEADARRFAAQITAPKMALPGHAESYNPPAEYLFSAEEQQRWEDDDPLERVPNFMPKKCGIRWCFQLSCWRRYAALRNVPAYDRFVQERFTRCLDLYLCPRTVRMRVCHSQPRLRR